MQDHRLKQVLDTVPANLHANTNKKKRRHLRNYRHPSVPAKSSSHSVRGLGGLYQHLDRANQTLGRLDVLTTLLPDTKFFLLPLPLHPERNPVVPDRGTQSSFSDLLLFENDAEPSVLTEDVEEVSNYVAAMQHVFAESGGFPFSLRLIHEIHAILLRGGRAPSATLSAFASSSSGASGERQLRAAWAAAIFRRLKPSQSSHHRQLGRCDSLGK